MAKGIKRFKVKNNSRKNAKVGDTYKINTDITVMDVDEDGVSDLVLEHQVDKNGQNWVDSKIVWYGLSTDFVGAFVNILNSVGYIDDDVIETTKLNVVLRHWKSLTRALGQINKLGEDLVVSVGEKVEE